MSSALGLCALTLSALFRTETQLRKDREQQLIASRLADRWRADAHAALACAADQECVFKLPAGRQAKYSIDGSTISREVIRDAATVHRDAFPLPQNAVPAFAVANREGREFAVLQVQPSGPDQPQSTSVRTSVLEAAVNLHGASAPAEAPP
jgi:hypothetical protein